MDHQPPFANQLKGTVHLEAHKISRRASKIFNRLGHDVIRWKVGGFKYNLCLSRHDVIRWRVGGFKCDLRLSRHAAEVAYELLFLVKSHYLAVV